MDNFRGNFGLFNGSANEYVDKSLLVRYESAWGSGTVGVLGCHAVQSGALCWCGCVAVGQYSWHCYLNAYVSGVRHGCLPSGVGWCACACAVQYTGPVRQSITVGCIIGDVWNKARRHADRYGNKAWLTGVSHGVTKHTEPLTFYPLKNVPWLTSKRLTVYAELFHFLTPIKCGALGYSLGYCTSRT
jgi:hypothetical protein